MKHGSESPPDIQAQYDLKKRDGNLWRDIQKREKERERAFKKKVCKIFRAELYQLFSPLLSFTK